MSNMYAFKESTLTALGDAVRKHAGEMREGVINAVVINNFNLADIPVEQLTALNSTLYQYNGTESIPLPTEASYYMVSCTGWVATPSSTITVYITGESGGKQNATMAAASSTPVKINKALVGVNPTISLYGIVRKVDYESGTGPKVDTITITAHAADGTQLEWVAQEKNTMTLAQMTEAIIKIPVSADCNGLHVPEEALVLTDGNQLFMGGKWLWFFETFKDRITTQDLHYTTSMFNSCSSIEEIPFEFNGCNASQGQMSDMFSWSMALRYIAPMNNFRPEKLDNMFQYCLSLRELPEFNNWDFSDMHVCTYGGSKNMFQHCYSLRSIPESLLKELYNAATSSYSTSTYYLFDNCYSLDEIRGVRGPNVTLTSNAFTNTFNNCSRVKDIIFATNEDGTPLVQQWKGQIINLCNNVGYCTSDIESSITGYNSGITSDKKMTSTTYRNLKNDPDAYATSASYSRYDHDSAVRTINSLPDTSAYLATSGGTNTIQFFGGSGINTTAGKINDLTEAEIAVATAKGWTVTLN